MDAPRPNTSTPSMEQRTTYVWKLPCGCILQHACQTKQGEIDDAAAIKMATRSHELLSFWFRDRQPRHQCALVSDENPNGIGPRAKKSEDVPA